MNSLVGLADSPTSIPNLSHSSRLAFDIPRPPASTATRPTPAKQDIAPACFRTGFVRAAPPRVNSVRLRSESAEALAEVLPLFPATSRCRATACHPGKSHELSLSIRPALGSKHRTQFVADSSHYAPQYGGYCAFAVANGTTAHGSPQQWAIVNDRVYLNNNVLAKALWDRDRPGHTRAADVNWPAIPKKDHPTDTTPSAP